MAQKMRQHAGSGFFFGSLKPEITPDGPSGRDFKLMFKAAYSYLKEIGKRIAMEIGWSPLFSPILQHPEVEWRLRSTRIGRGFYRNRSARFHPFDRLNGTDTSGIFSPDDFPAGDDSGAHATQYAGSQPSVLRQALAALPPLEGFTFLDLGCGKGRALLVAAEFPFRRLLGVELSPRLAETARRNIAAVATRFPQRIQAEVVVGDAGRLPIPDGDVVIFLFNPFHAGVMSRVVTHIEAALAGQSRCIYVVYDNPIAGHCFDASSDLRRRFARLLDYDAADLGYGPGDASPLVIWQGGTAPPPAEPANAKIIVEEGLRWVWLDDC